MVQNVTITFGTSDTANPRRRRGFWSNVFGRSSNADESREHQQQRRKGNSLMNNVRQAATKEVMHVAEEEAVKQVKMEMHNNNGSQADSQPPDTNTSTANMTPDTSTAARMTMPSDGDDDVLSAPTNWAKRMVDNVQQKVQSLQNLAS